MARAGTVGEWGRRISRRLSYKKITIAVCSLNLLAALIVLKSLYASFSDLASPGRPASLSAVKYTEEQIRRIEEAIRVRQAAEPVELVNLVKKLKKELEGAKRRWELSDSVKQETANDILRRLRGLNETEVTEQRGWIKILDIIKMVSQIIDAVELWRVEKLEEIKSKTIANLTSDSNIPAQETLLKRALKFDWLRLLEDIGFWMPANVNNTQIDDKPENAQELEEEEAIPGRPMPSECHAERHTDYDGAAVRWGLTHHKESAADCCQACLDQAKNAKPGWKKCNIWVYCPSEYGCYSPDIYEHKHQECWLKQDIRMKMSSVDCPSEWFLNEDEQCGLSIGMVFEPQWQENFFHVSICACSHIS